MGTCNGHNATFVSVLTLARFPLVHNPHEIQMPGLTECTKWVKMQFSILWIFLLIFVVAVISFYDFQASANIWLCLFVRVGKNVFAASKNKLNLQHEVYLKNISAPK